jgi:hypothetical protein
MIRRTQFHCLKVELDVRQDLRVAESHLVGGDGQKVTSRIIRAVPTPSDRTSNLHSATIRCKPYARSEN